VAPVALALAVVLLAAAGLLRGHAEEAAGGPLIGAVAAVGLTVSDLDRSVGFYTRVLGFEAAGAVETWGEEAERLQGLFGLRMRTARLRLGQETLELTEYLTPRGRPIPAGSRSHDGWFQHVALVVSDMEGAYAWLRRHGVEHASPAPQRLPDWNESAGGIRAFYFKDPDGHPLEIIQFPPGKGAARWHEPTAGRLFRGIDHTAIVVGDTDRSLRCYRDTLGLRVAGASENWGPEQERLNNVFGARLRITTLRAEAGAGVELLEYLTPRDGRPIPADARPNDLAHWQTVLLADDAEAVARALRGSACAMVSPAVARPDPALGFARGFLARDPDGHAFQVIER
jgi:catechol 2,3-dioxygenase-like lactoylglutathione lyase family enzyme